MRATKFVYVRLFVCGKFVICFMISALFLHLIYSVFMAEWNLHPSRRSKNHKLTEFCSDGRQGEEKSTDARALPLNIQWHNVTERDSK